MRSIYRRLFLPVYFPTLLIAVVQSAAIILLPLFILESGHGVALASFVVALRGVGTLLADIPAGLIANRFGDKPTMLLGAICALIAMIILSITDIVGLILVAAVFLGSGTGFSILGRLSYITDSCASDERGRVIALMAGLQRGGALLGPLVFSVVAKYLGYGPTFAILMVLVCIALLSVALFAENIEAKHRKEAPMSAMLNLLWEYRQVFLTAGFAGIALMMLRSARELLFPLFGHSFGLDVAQVGFVFAISSAVDMSMFYPAGQIMDRKGRKWTGVPGLLILSLALVILPFLPSMTGMLIFAVLSGVGNGITTGVLLTICSDLAPEKERGQFIGLWRLEMDIGVAFAPFMVGVLAETVSLSIASLSVAGFGFAGAVMLAFFVKESLKRGT